MKNTIRFLGIIAFVAIIGFSMAACDNGNGDDGDGGGSSNAVIGAKLELSGQVYEFQFNEANYTVTYPEYKGNMTLSDNNGGTVTITGGKLSYSIETPNNLETLDLDNFFRDYDNVTASGSNVKGFVLELYKIDGDNYNYTYYSLSKENIVYSLGNTSGTMTSEDVKYVYVDGDVTISGKGKSGTYPLNVDPNGVSSGTFTYKTNNFSLALKEGWNAVYTKSVSSATYPAGNPSAATSVTSTETISLNNPALKWVYGASGGGGSSIPEVQP